MTFSPRLREEGFPERPSLALLRDLLRSAHGKYRVAGARLFGLPESLIRSRKAPSLGSSRNAWSAFAQTAVKELCASGVTRRSSLAGKPLISGLPIHRRAYWVRTKLKNSRLSSKSSHTEGFVPTQLYRFGGAPKTTPLVPGVRSCSPQLCQKASMGARRVSQWVSVSVNQCFSGSVGSVSRCVGGPTPSN